MALLYIVLEKCIYNNVYKVVKALVNTHQHEFMTGESCTTQLLYVYDVIVKHLDEGKQADMIVLQNFVFSGSHYQIYISLLDN